jgi:hypothetical protein
MTIPIRNTSDPLVRSVAFISSNGDEELADLIFKVY